MFALYLLLGAVIGALSVLAYRGRSVRVGASTVSGDAMGSAPPHTAPTEQSELDRIRAALDALAVGVVYSDTSGRVLVRNSVAEHVAGARHGDVLVEEAVGALLRAAARGDEGRRTLELFGPPARVLVIDAQPVEGGGAIATISDITERARVDAVRTDFVANISHELKTPVGAISLLAETLADADDPEVVDRLSGKLVKEAERLALTIDDLLELSRIELGGDALRESVSVDVILRDAAERVQGLAERRHIKIMVSEPAETLTVLGDRRQLISALGNLIDNAVKYSDAGSDVEVGARLDGDWVSFLVTDHGMGIASQHLERIFERFYRVDRARSRDTGGVGLGLAIVRHVAVNHGGHVNVESREGEGSTFKLILPSAHGSLKTLGVTDVSPAAG